LKAYGPDAFVPVPEPVPARHMHSGDRHGILLNVLHWISSNGRVLVRAGDRRVVVDASGNYALEDRADDSRAA